MTHQERDRGEVMPAALCACGCGKPWTKWCKGCNLVYCDKHAPNTKHPCLEEEDRSVHYKTSRARK